MSSSESWKKLEAQIPSENSEKCKAIQDDAEQILAGKKLSDELQEHRETCLCCIRFLAEKLMALKAGLPSIPVTGVLAMDDLGYAAGAQQGFRSIHATELSKAGLSSGWHIDIKEIDSSQLKLTIISDLPKEVNMSLKNAKGEELITLSLSQLPVYLDRKLADQTDKVILREVSKDD